MHTASRLAAPTTTFAAPFATLEPFLNPPSFHPLAVFTGYSQTWEGKSTFATGYVPDGEHGGFDVLTCKDNDTGEVQDFNDYPVPPDSSFDMD